MKERQEQNDEQEQDQLKEHEQGKKQYIPDDYDY